MDDRYAPQPVARWYMLAAIASLLFMTLGCVALFMHVTADRAKLPLDQRALLASLIAMLVWLGGMFATPAFRDLLGPTQIAVLLIVVAVTWTIFWFARHSRQRGWLR